MMTLWAIVLSFIIICTILSSVRVGVIGFRKIEARKLIAFLTHPAWCLFMIMFLPWQMGEFARGENSPLPWEAFAKNSLRHGVFDGLLSAAIVIAVLLWLFWIPASIWINKNPEADKTKRIMARTINILLGLLLTQVANPIYRLLD